jgi:hypothetical protein
MAGRPPIVSGDRVLVVTRHQVPAGSEAEWLGRARAAVAALAERPGYRSARIGRAVDDRGLFVLETEWDHVGAYRRALSGFDVKVTAWPVLGGALDEPSAFELLHADGLASEGWEPVGLGPTA